MVDDSEIKWNWTIVDYGFISLITPSEIFHRPVFQPQQWCRDRATNDKFYQRTQPMLAWHNFIGHMTHDEPSFN